MSLSGTLSDNQSFSNSMVHKNSKQPEANLFQKIDILAA
jgi:hypothetical protein